MFTLRLLALLMTMGVLCAGCRQRPLAAFPDRQVLWVDDDRRPLDRAPKSLRRGFAGWTIQAQLIEPMRRLFGGGALGPSWNVNALDEVPDSTWFENRNHRRRQSLRDVRRGAARTTGPQGPFKLTRAGIDGAGPYAVLRDARKELYLLRFDAPGWPRLATTASLVTTLLLHVVGYHVPARWLIRIKPAAFVFTPKTLWRDDTVLLKGRWKSRPRDLARVLGSASYDARGRVRAVATLLGQSKPLGPFRYEGRRPGDDNDYVSHELRRELRGLLPVAAWLNLTGITDAVPRDLYLEGKARYVLHTLWSLRGGLGSRLDGQPKTTQDGFAYRFDVQSILTQLLTLGFTAPRWPLLMKHRAELLRKWPALGWFGARAFQPRRWRPALMNAAFARAEPADILWGARLVASLSKRQISAAVAQARLPKWEHERLVRVLLRRRKRALRWALRAHAPLAHIRVTGGRARRLCFIDLWQREHLSARSKTVYEMRVSRLDGRRVMDRRLTTTGRPRVCVPIAGATSGPGAYHIFALRRPALSPKWVRVHVRASGDLAGIDR